MRLLFYLILLGVALGISLAGPPGPVTSVIVLRARSSALSGFLVGLGAMTADFILMILVFLFYGEISGYHIDLILYPVGAGIFFLMAALILQGNEPSSAVLLGNGYILGLEMGIVNPFQIAWWAGAGLSVLGTFGIFPFYFLFLGIILWISFLSISINRSVLKYGRKLSQAIRFVSAAIQIGFSATFLYLWILLL